MGICSKYLVHTRRSEGAQSMISPSHNAPLCTQHRTNVALIYASLRGDKRKRNILRAFAYSVLPRTLMKKKKKKIETRPFCHV